MASSLPRFLRCLSGRVTLFNFLNPSLPPSRLPAPPCRNRRTEVITQDGVRIQVCMWSSRTTQAAKRWLWGLRPSTPLGRTTGIEKGARRIRGRVKGSAGPENSGGAEAQRVSNNHTTCLALMTIPRQCRGVARPKSTPAAPKMGRQAGRRAGGQGSQRHGSRSPASSLVQAGCSRGRETQVLIKNSRDQADWTANQGVRGGR